MIKIIADSTCDLSKEVVKEYGIKVVSSIVIVNGQKFNDYDYDGSSLDDFYLGLDHMTEPPGYEPPSPNVYRQAIEDGVFHGITEFIIIIPSSQQIDDFAEVVNTAIRQFMETNKVPNVRIQMINTLNVSQGFGFTVLTAAKMAKNGKSFDEIIKYCEIIKNKVKAFLSVPDVDFLYKTGNVTKGGAQASKLLGITPILKLGTTGKAQLASKVVGEGKIAQSFTNEFKRNADIEAGDFVIIGYSTDRAKAEDTMKRLIQDAKYDGDVYIMQMRPAFGVHMGKRAMGIYFLGKQGSVALFNIFRFN